MAFAVAFGLAEFEHTSNMQVGNTTCILLLEMPILDKSVSEMRIGPDLQILLAVDDRDAKDAKKIYNNCKDEFGFMPEGAFLRSKNEGELVIARKGAQTIGYLRFHDRKDGVRKIYDMAVAEDHRRTGIGTRLLASLCKKAPRSGICCIELLCPEDLPANLFYDQCGFREIDRIPGKSRRLVVWRKNLDNGANV